MSKRPQFSLKALLVIIAVLAVPLGMMVVGDRIGDRDCALFGAVYALPVLFGCIGYLLGGWRGVAIGVVTTLVAMLYTLLLFYVDTG